DSLSDIDVMIIGNHSIVKLQKEIAKIQKDYDRVINITNMDMNEYLKNKNKTFLKKVLEGDVVELI
ncbi:hypothetical protein KKA47_07320, partial [bacterium]|nr:hypothetical protein [bacterium]